MSTSSVHTLAVEEVSVYRGPHLFSHLPMIRIQLALGTLEALPTPKLGRFTEQLLALLPGLQQHGCCYEEPGGFVRRLEEGTWIGHVIEHVALELQKLAGADVSRGKTRSVKGRTGAYNVMYQYDGEDLGLLAGACALRLVEALLPPPYRGVKGIDIVTERLDAETLQEATPLLAGGLQFEAWIACLRKHHKRVTLGPTTAALVAEARRRGIPVLRLDDSSLVQLGHGSRQRRVWAAMTTSTSQIAVDIAADKDLTKALLRNIGLPVPRGIVVQSPEELQPALEDLDLPVVTKPLYGNHGRGVTLHIRTPEELARGHAAAAAISKCVVVEEQYAGKDYRILVVSGRVIAVAERVPAHVTGDGISTVAQLIEAENRDPRRGDGHENVMTRIVVDEAVIQTLGLAGLTVNSIPAPGEQVMLRSTGNISTGGTAIDCTENIHPDNAAIAERAALAVGLDVAGIDFIAPDISQSVLKTGGGIVEVNAAPGLRMHMAPSVGTPRPVAKAIIDTIFPNGEDGRIPIFALTGTNGKSTTALMLSCILRKAGLKVGLANTSGIFINGVQVMKADASGPRSARAILRDPTIDAAVLETARGGIMREGLAFTECDVGAVLNVDVDHLGLRDLETVEDLAWAKSLVVEVVRRRGVSVLNADDPHTLAMAGRAGGDLCYFSLQGDTMPEVLREHIAEGGMAVVRSRRWTDEIVLYDRGRKERLIAVSEMPAALGGAAAFNIANAMAAAAMAYGYGIGLEAIRAGLSSFSNSFGDNPGRLNICDDHGFRVIVDYGHNQASLRAVGEVVSQMENRYGHRIGMISMPGDRRDDDLREMGRIAAGIFDELVFRETPDQRGRPPGQINALMAEGALSAGFPREGISGIVDEFDAVDYCLRAGRPNDLVVLMATRFDEVWQRVKDFRPAPQPKTPTLTSRPECNIAAGH